MLTSRQCKAIEHLVAGANDTETARRLKANPSTIWRWKNEDDEFALELKNRTADSMSDSCRVVGAQVRAAAEVGLLATQQLQKILLNADAPGWMKLGAAQGAMKHARWAADKVDKDFNKLETVGQNDPERQKVADDLTRRIEQCENRDRTLARLQRYEENRMQERIRQREAELLRRLNVMCQLNEQDKEYMYRFYRREDDWDVAMENTRREKAREEFAQAAGVSIDKLPAPAPLQWADMREQFKGFVDALPEPTTPDQAAAEIERAKNLSYPDPNSPEEKAYLAKFAEDLKAVEADYRANVLPKGPSSPIERESSVGSAGVPAEIPLKSESRLRLPSAPGSSGSSGSSPTSENSNEPQQPEEGRRGTPALPTRNETSAPGKWTTPIPDQDSPEREAYLASLADDEVPELSEADRRRKEDWDQRRKRSEENERFFEKQKKHA